MSPLSTRTPPGPGIEFLTRLTLLREVNYDLKTNNLVSNPIPELVGLRTGSLASESDVALSVSQKDALSNQQGGGGGSLGSESTTPAMPPLDPQPTSCQRCSFIVASLPDAQTQTYCRLPYRPAHHMLLTVLEAVQLRRPT